MHEGQFSEKIVDAIISELKKFPGKKPKSVLVKVGEVFHLVPDAVKMHFSVLTKGTTLEGVHLDLKEESMEVYCPHCQQATFVEDHHLVACPLCYAVDVKPIRGNQITVESIELCNS
ncbi:MAG: hydrogenase maturation nickel metallochaperone HypA [Candidatus Omnitrophica bacterium]|nr:hydrogenase maturation nickel metallochaperone HypA [Candidatus Omnitrophota bacterium]